MSSWRDWPSSLLTGPSERLSAPVEHGHRHGAEYWKYMHTHRWTHSGERQLHKPLSMLTYTHTHTQNGTKTEVNAILEAKQKKKNTEVSEPLCSHDVIALREKTWQNACVCLCLKQIPREPSRARSKCAASGSPAVIIMIHAIHVWGRLLPPEAWEKWSGHCISCVSARVVAYASLGLSVITLGDTPHMTNELDLGARRLAHLSQDGR